MTRLLWGLCVLGWAAVAWASSGPEREATYAKLDVFAKVLNYVQTHHVDPKPPERLVYGAIEGLVNQLDAHSEFLTPEAYAALVDGAEPPRVGIGVRLGPAAQGLRVEAVIVEGPADRAGIREGDVVLEIDGQPVSDRVPVARERLAGSEGEPVGLVLRRGRERFERRVRRAPLRPVHAVGERTADGIGRVRIERFTRDLPLDLARILEVMAEQGPIRGVLLDLRGNTGGLVEAAARVADLWLEAGTIVTTEARGRVLEKYVARRFGTQPDYPLVLLVDGKTASSAEIVAAALQERDRAQVVGTRTFGKGSVQTLIELEDGSALKLTVARHYTPGHRSVQGVGVEPDHPVSPAAQQTDGDGDAAEARALAVLRRAIGRR